MNDLETADTRARIVAVARDLFGEHGYHRTTLRAIAERLRLSKAAILYHFPTKANIFAAVATPLVTEAEQMLDRAEQLEPDQARWAALEGWLDILLRHRSWLRLMLYELAVLGRMPIYQRLLRLMLRMQQIVSGPDAGLAERILASQATAMLGDPVLFHADISADVLREQVLSGVYRLYAAPDVGPEAENGSATGVRRRVGRPSAMTAEKIALARRMHAEGQRSVEQIAAMLGVSRATLYRHLAPRGLADR